ncbi:flavodoxin domain-containing protein [Pseudarthrobacter sp. NKDBFgelt]|uniref:flavodoxin domain-containing protein n=1 Tax=Pseudarthrobacter sp. NKDBFgelt TaxID=3384443 RepID=UPI0038D43615
MSRTVILYGTESGNAELVAEDIGEELDGGAAVAISDMSEFDVAELSSEDFYIIICSTHGDGELPTSARPFHEALSAAHPDLSGVKYAMFGLGDSTYETYSQGSEHVDRVLTELGAERVGEYGRHDAADGSLPNDAAVAWSRTLPIFV